MKIRNMIMPLVMCMVFLMTLPMVYVAKATAKGDFPKKNITWIVPYPPGGGFDTYSRPITRIMPRYLPKKVKVIIKNVPGAGSTRGTSLLYRSKPDGYTIGILNFPGLAAAEMVMKTEYELDKFTYIGRIAVTQYCLSLPKGSAFKTLKDLQRAERVKFADTGKGATGYLITRIGTASLKIPDQMVTGYNSSVASIVAAIRGDVDAVITGGVATQLPYIEAGDLRPILTFATKRHPFLPDTPTVNELGYGEELGQLALHRLIAAPPGLPADVAEILRKALKQSLEDKELIKWGKETKRPLDWASAEESSTIVSHLSNMLKKYGHLIK